MKTVPVSRPPPIKKREPQVGRARDCKKGRVSDVKTAFTCTPALKFTTVSKHLRKRPPRRLVLKEILN